MGVYIWGANETHNLPSAYQEVEYIEGSGNDTTGTYIDTGFEPNNNTKYVVDFLSVEQGSSPIGCYNNPSGFGLLINTDSGTYNTGIHYGTQYAGAISIVCDNRVRITIDGNKVYEGDTLKHTFSAQTFQMNINAWLFCWNRNGTQSNNFGTRIRSAKIYDNGTLVRDFVPCYRKSDNVIGMYDIVNNQFYTNSGTGTFTKGNDIPDIVQKELKNAYIGEYQGVLYTPGIYSKNGVISISGDGINWYSMSNKNLNASNVGDYGTYYQWGNNYGFANSGSVTKTTTKVDTTGYGPGNYYSSSTFIYGSGDWSNPSNNNLWGDTTDTATARQGPCSSGYHIPSVTEMSGVISAGTALGLSGGAWLVNYLNIPYAGLRDTSCKVQFQGSWGFYWTSSAVSGNSSNGIFLQFNSSIIEASTLTTGIDKIYGFSIRPFKNTPSIPDNTRTVVYQGS